MKRLILIARLFSGTIAFAQREPHVAYVYPAGGQQGTTFNIVIAGRFLSGPTNLYVSGSGISAKVIDYSRPLTPKEVADLREQARILQEKKAAASRLRKRPETNSAQNATNVVWTPQDERLLGELKMKVMRVNRPPNPEIAEPVTLEVTIDSNAEPGQRELRLRSGTGLSNPLFFQVGQLPETTEEADAPDSRARYGRTTSNQPLRSAPVDEMNITIPCVVNGQIMPGGVDRYRFKSQKGQRLVIAAHARSLIPYLANAVPGWFQAVVTLYDAHGNELAYQDDFRFNPDPVLFFETPADGEYVVSLKDSIYRGREDFVYRLSIAETPFVTSVFPLGGTAGQQKSVSLSGWNLPTNALSFSLNLPAAGSTTVCVTNNGFTSNRLPISIDTLPEFSEVEPNDSPSASQKTSFPIIINGRIDRPGDTDSFSFEATAGSIVVAEALARRLNSPLDSMLKLTDSSHRQIAFNDDHEDKAAGLVSHHADSYVRATLETTGVYYLQISDTQGQGSPAHAYRVRISPPQPDFELRVAPATINVRAGNSAPFTVYALRRDGFTNEIKIILTHPAAGFTLKGALIPANEEKAQLHISVPWRRSHEDVSSITLQGAALIGGVETSRIAIPAEDMMQAFAYRHLVPAQELKICVLRNPAGKSAGNNAR